MPRTGIPRGCLEDELQDEYSETKTTDNNNNIKVLKMLKVLKVLKMLQVLKVPALQSACVMPAACVFIACLQRPSALIACLQRG